MKLIEQCRYHMLSVDLTSHTPTRLVQMGRYSKPVRWYDICPMTRANFSDGFFFSMYITEVNIEANTITMDRYSEITLIVELVVMVGAPNIKKYEEIKRI